MNFFTVRVLKNLLDSSTLWPWRGPKAIAAAVGGGGGGIAEAADDEAADLVEVEVLPGLDSVTDDDEAGTNAEANEDAVDTNGGTAETITEPDDDADAGIGISCGMAGDRDRGALGTAPGKNFVSLSWRCVLSAGGGALQGASSSNGKWGAAGSSRPSAIAVATSDGTSGPMNVSFPSDSISASSGVSWVSGTSRDVAGSNTRWWWKVASAFEKSRSYEAGTAEWWNRCALSKRSTLPLCRRT